MQRIWEDIISLSVSRHIARSTHIAPDDESTDKDEDDRPQEDQCGHDSYRLEHLDATFNTSV